MTDEQFKVIKKLLEQIEENTNNFHSLDDVYKKLESIEKFIGLIGKDVDRISDKMD